MSPELAQTLGQLSPEQRLRLQQQLASRQITGQQAVATNLKHLGITHIYGVAGVPIHGAFGELTKQGIRVVGTRHQQGATLMAIAQNYTVGKLVAAVYVSPGPAITNTLTGVLVAWDNAWPLLVIATGCADCPPGTFQALAGESVLQAVTKHCFHITEAQEIATIFSQAATLAINGRPGTVYVEIDRSVYAQSIKVTAPLKLPVRSINDPDPKAVTQAINVLSQAKRPLLLIGKGVRWSVSQQDLMALVEQGIPFIASPMGQGFIPDCHPNNVTPIAAIALSEADVVLGVGMRWNWTFRFGAELASTAQVIQIDVDPDAFALMDHHLSNPTVKLKGDAGEILTALLTGLAETPGLQATEVQNWSDHLQLACRAKRQHWSSLSSNDLDLPTLFHELSKQLPTDAITILDGDFTLKTGQRRWSVHQPASRLTPGTNGCMGTGLPFAMGAKMAHPDRCVVVVTGDFAFGLNAMELETAMRYHLPIIVIITNNQGNGGSTYQRQNYAPDYPDLVTMFTPCTRYSLIAQAFGGYGAEIHSLSELETAIQMAIARNVPSCLNVHLDPDAPFPSL